MQEEVTQKTIALGLSSKVCKFFFTPKFTQYGLMLMSQL